MTNSSSIPERLKDNNPCGYIFMYIHTKISPLFGDQRWFFTNLYARILHEGDLYNGEKEDKRAN